ncbi:MAG: hypothetical protein K2M19_09400 [Muribaculaceae bacterium]|nr:hypothetical protein [Muribaculaceae bacterium]
MKKILPFLLPLLALFIYGCEEDESPLLFDSEQNTAPQNIKIEYYSVDPSCLPKEYHIVTNRHAGELTLHCTNAPEIFLARFTRSGDTFVSEEGHWSVSVMDRNKLKFVFQEVEKNSELDFVYENNFVTVCAEHKKGTVTTSIQIWRDLNADYTFD